ncbi:16123_t:CDS:1, partial [Gigaspora rosea]
DANPLLKRGEDKDVCVIAKSVFHDEVTGIITFAEKEKGCTYVFGLFSKGLDDPKKNCYNVLVEDCDGKVVANLTDSIEFADDGTKPFFTKIDVDLKDLLGSGDKRKRQAAANAVVTSNSGTVSTAPLSAI